MAMHRLVDNPWDYVHTTYSLRSNQQLYVSCQDPRFSLYNNITNTIVECEVLLERKRAIIHLSKMVGRDSAMNIYRLVNK